MVAGADTPERSVLTRVRGATVGVIAAIAPAALSLLVFVGTYPWFAFTIAISCLGSGAVIGSTIGRRLALRPDPLGILMVAAIAVVVGALVAASVLPLGLEYVDPLGTFFGGLVIFGIPAYFCLAFPGLVIGIVIARRAMPGRDRPPSTRELSGAGR